MTSGEWDLRALKALEEEEQKEFLALSQRNLFEPPSPSGGGSTSNICVGGNAAGVTAKLPPSFAQLHPHLLKLPTIEECQAAAKRQAQSAANNSARLKFSRSLSLSAHSLSSRSRSAAGGGSSFGNKLKARLVGTKSSGSLSPSRHSYSVSPVYTPPPIRRCATLHHTQPVRKTFKTLQQLERQKLERRQQQQQQQHQQQQQQQQHSIMGGTAATMPAQMQRIAGTNKTYWKYGANSTAASIIGQRVRRQHMTDLESNTSDEFNSETEAAQLEQDDSATETGSCSVPLPAANSNELLRLMLTAASSAVTATQSKQPLTATTVATSGKASSFLGATTQRQYGEPEAVAYEAFAHTANRKSFALLCNGNRTLLRGRSLTAQESPSRSQTIDSTAATGDRKLLKSTSMDEAGGDYQQQHLITRPTSTVGHNNHLDNAELNAQTRTQTLTQLTQLSANLHFNEQQTNEARSQQGSQYTAYQSELQQGHCYAHGAAPPPSDALIDDELEQHIKHCSCSCNHMGYGNSMDYQVSFVHAL